MPHHGVENIKVVLLLRRRQAQIPSQFQDGGFVGVDELAKGYAWTAILWNIPNPGHRLGRVTDAQKRIIQARLTMV